MEVAVMQPTDGNGVFVADLAAKRTRLGKANVVRFGGRPAADYAGLSSDEFAVFFVAQTNGLRGHATWSCASGKDDRMCFGVEK